MLKILNYKNKNSSRSLEVFLSKRRSTQKGLSLVINKIIKNVRNKGDKAVLEYEKKFSKISNTSNKVVFSNK